MKTILATLITAVVGLIALPSTAEAGPRSHCNSSYTYRSGTTSCGCAIYTKRVFTGYDCYNRPTYRYYQVPVTHRCRNHYRPKPPCRSNYYYNSNRHYRHSHYHHRGHSRQINLRTPFGRVSICR